MSEIQSKSVYHGFLVVEIPSTSILTGANGVSGTTHQLKVQSPLVAEDVHGEYIFFAYAYIQQVPQRDEESGALRS